MTAWLGSHDHFSTNGKQLALHKGGVHCSELFKLTEPALFVLSLATITTPQNNGNVECTSGTLYKSWVFTSLSLNLAEHQKTLHLDTSQASAAEGPAPPTLEDLLALGSVHGELFG